MKPTVGAACLGFFAVTCIWWLSGRAPAQPAAAPSPAQYQVILRHRIVAPRDQHALLYDRLVDHLRSLKFDFQPPLAERPPTDRIDPNKNEFRGRVAATDVKRLRDNPYVAGVLLLPDGFKLPEAGDQPVRVRIELVAGLATDRQRDLAEQTKLLLAILGFKEATGYDHRGISGLPFTRLIGTLPAGQLEVLLKDLRLQPSGWLAPQIGAGDLPTPLRTVEPIWYTEVLMDPEPIKDVAPSASRSPEYLEKIGTGLWEIVSDKEKEGALVRVQVLFAGSPSAAALRQLVERVAPSAFVEGVAGSYVTAHMTARHTKALAARLDVLAVRLPVPVRVAVDPELPAAFEPAKVLQQSGLAELHRRGKRGQGVRLAILDYDFRGWQQQVKNGKLPAATRLVDITAERSPEILPAPERQGVGLGHGAQCAIAAAVAAPDAEIILVRIGDDDPQQILEAHQVLRGGLVSATLERRMDELRLANTLLILQRNRLLAERRKIFESFRDEEELRSDFGFLGPVYGWIFSDRDWHRQHMEHQDKLDRELVAKENRYWKLVEQIQGLKDIPIVASALLWNDAYPLGGASALSRGLDANPGPLWFQAAGNTAGQAWTGMYRDMDSNGVMEFAQADAKLPKGRWSPELNFLGWQAHAGKSTADLPDKANLRISLQWREPHDEDYFLPLGDEDPYRQPLAELRMLLLRQRDPDGKTVGADAFDVVARSTAVPGRLDHQPAGTSYEQVLEYTVPQAGRYALRVERAPARQWVLSKVQERYFFELKQGLTAIGVRPLVAPTLPGLEKSWELQPRLFVDVTDDATGRQGRPQFIDFATPGGAIGIPGDAGSVITVGAAGLNDRPQPYSASGPPPFLELAQKPSIWTYDAVRLNQGGAWGTSLASAFAAGTSATLLSSGATRVEILQQMRRQQGQVFHTGATESGR